MATTAASASPRVAIVHDFLLYPGGAEKVLASLLALYPDAPIYTLLYDPVGMAPMRAMLEGRVIRTSFLQRLPHWLRSRTKWLLPLLPTAPETFDLRDFDLVISSSSAWSKGVITRVSTVHVAYVHSPMRFVWDDHASYIVERTPWLLRIVVRWLLSYLRVWDFEAAQRPDVLLANSHATARRIAKFYRREAAVVYPPVVLPAAPAATAAHDGTRSFLVVSRLSEYKKVTLAVEVCTKLALPLTVIGTGRQEEMLRRMAGPTVRVLGWQSDAQVARHYAHARALLFPAEEDFGITMVEALGHGVPVIAYGRGGACEIVEPGVTGELFYAQTPEVLADGIRRFLEHEGSYDTARMRARAAMFAAERFQTAVRDAAAAALSNRAPAAVYGE